MVDFITETHAARLLGIAPSVLAYHTKKGRGPLYEKIAGKRFYDPNMIMGWKPKRLTPGPKKNGHS